MSLLKLTPVIYTRDIPGTLNFYTGKLGFRCIAFEEKQGWARIQNEVVDFMITLPNEHLPFERPIFTGSFYILTNQVDDLWNRLKDQVVVCYPIEDFDYGMREFAIYENNGYLLQFGQEMIEE